MNKVFWLRFLSAAVLIAATFSVIFLNTYTIAFSPSEEVINRSGSDFNVILDAGHGGEDGGAVSLTGAFESDINLYVALKAEQLFAFFGIAPIMTRTSNEINYPPEADTIRAKKVFDVKNRVDLINKTENAVLISIHQNKYSTASPKGCQVFFADTIGSKNFADKLQELFIGNTDAGNRKNSTKISDSIYMMNAINCPAVLIECGFISNPQEAQLLENSEYQTKLAAIIVGGYIGFENELKKICLEA